MTFVGVITAGDLEVDGKVEGDMHCSSVIVTRSGHIVGAIRANRIVVDGRVEGPIECDDITFNSHANVVGDVQCKTFVVEQGAFIEGKMRQLPRDGAKLLLTDQEIRNGRETVNARRRDVDFLNQEDRAWLDSLPDPVPVFRDNTAGGPKPKRRTSRFLK